MTVAGTLDQLIPNAELFTDSNPVGMGGLRATDGRAFPLQKVRVRSSIAGPCARTEIEQHFANRFDELLDVTWIFPLPSDGAVVELELRAGDITVVGECRARDDARAVFDTARAQGNRAALVETEQRGVHTLSLAGLPPRSDVTIRLTIVELLPATDGRFRWQFPTTIAPRYTPGAEVGQSGFGTSPDTDAVPNASRLTPPLRLAGGTTLDLEVEIDGPLSSLESSLHAVKMSLNAGRVRVAPSALSTLNADFILEFSTAEASATVSRAYTDGVYTVAIVEPPADIHRRVLPRDAVFVVDISGSMEGTKLEAAKVALMGALHGLQYHDRFKLLAFDDRVDRFNAEFVDYNESNLRAADAWIAGLHSRGGTEMLAAIQESLAGDTPSGRVRTVLFITDGQSSDEARLLPAVANRRGNAVLFTLGIDTAVNASLLKLLAKAGGGACELCTPTDDIDAVVAKLETRFGTPVLSDLRASGAARPDGQTVFHGRPASILIEGAPDAIQLSGTAPTGEFRASIVPVRVGFSLGAVWARERVSWLEERLTVRPFEEEAIKPEIIRVALAHHIASKFTSFVCVDRSVTMVGERRHVVQPVELPQQWNPAVGGSARPMFAKACAPLPSLDSPMPAPPPRMWTAPSPIARMFSNEPAEVEPTQSVSPDAASAGFSIRETIDRLFHSRAPHSPADALPGSMPTPSRFKDKNGALPSRNVATDDYAGTLARSQNADGSYGNDVGRSAAALVALLLLGLTRRKGDRRRTVRKVADWLETHSDDARAVMALNALNRAESSTGLDLSFPEWAVLTTEGEEGLILKQLFQPSRLAQLSKPVG